jgi:hypothetical protein
MATYPPLPLDYRERQQGLIAARKQMEAAQTAEEQWLATIALHHAEHPRLTYREASDAVQKAMPALFTAADHERRYPHLPQPSVIKEHTPVLTPEAVIKTARARAATHGTSPREELFKLREAAEGTDHVGVVHEAWRAYHNGEGVDDWYRERLGIGQAS